LPITVGRSSGPAFLDSLVVADDFLDDEIKEFFREIRVEFGIGGKPAKPSDLGRLA
jgi:hypothetical protein